MSLDRSTIWPYDERGEHGDFFYQRYAHPTGVAAERALGDLDGGHALLFPSGAGATTALALSVLRPGSTVALAAGVYFGTGRLLAALEPLGRQRRRVRPDGPAAGRRRPRLARGAVQPFPDDAGPRCGRRAPGTVVVDATVATPVHLRPLEHGADFVLHSATKYLAGHDDVLLGVVVAKDEDKASDLRQLRGTLGIVAAPDPCWLLLRSLETLEVRVERQSATARELAARLDAHPAVQIVRYPGFGGLLSFDVADGDAARGVETATRVITNATSLGGTHSVMESRHRWEGDRVPTGLLRLSVGLEDCDSLWADLEQALNRV